MADKIWSGRDAGNEGDLATAANWTPSGVPAAGDNVLFPKGAFNVTANFDELSTASLTGALGVVIFDDYDGAAGDADNYVQFTCSRLEYAATGVSYINIEASAIGPRIRGTGSGGQGDYGLYLLGSAIGTLDLMGGSVAVAPLNTQTSAITTARVIGSTAELRLGSGVTLTTYYQNDGTGAIHCAATTVTAYGGTITTREVGAITTINNRGATIFPNSTGTITTLNADGGLTDFMTSAAARTVTTLKQNPRGSVKYDPAVLTVTNRSAPDYPIILSGTEP
jgi:hypothetical protein